jgi:hypothetical protein
MFIFAVWTLQFCVWHFSFAFIRRPLCIKTTIFQKRFFSVFRELDKNKQFSVGHLDKTSLIHGSSTMEARKNSDFLLFGHLKTEMVSICETSWKRWINTESKMSNNRQKRLGLSETHYWKGSIVSNRGILFYVSVLQTLHYIQFLQKILRRDLP